MPTTDHMKSFLFAVLVHLSGLLLLAKGYVLLNEAPETPPVPEAVSVELILSGADNENPAGADMEKAAAAAPVAAPAGMPPPLELPKTLEPLPPPSLPDKPSFADVLTPSPEPAPEPIPVSAPAPQPSPPSTPAVQPVASSGKTPQAPGSPVAGDSQQATLLPAGGGGGAYSRDDTHPSLKRAIRPNYPIGARRRGEEGTVILDVSVSADGRANGVTRVSSCGFSELDNAAERAAAQARFKPGTRNGHPVDSAARLTIIFRLRDL